MKAWARGHEASKGSAERLPHFGAGELKTREAPKRTFLCSRLSGSWRPNPCQVLPSSEGCRQQGASQKKVTFCPRQAQVNGYKDIRLYLRPLLPLSPTLMPPWRPYPAQTGSWAYAWGTWRWVPDLGSQKGRRPIMAQAAARSSSVAAQPAPGGLEATASHGGGPPCPGAGTVTVYTCCLLRSAAAGLRLTDPAPHGPQAQPPRRLCRRCSTGLGIDPAC